MDKATGQRSGWQRGLESVVQLPRLCLLSVVSEQHPIKSQRGHSGPSERERGKNMETKRRRWGGWEGGAMSCLWPERREGPRDMTDYRQGQSSRPMPRPQLSVMGQEGGCGAQRGAANKKGRSWWKKVEKRKRKRRKKSLSKDSATKCPGLCGSLLLQMLSINHETYRGAQRCSFIAVYLNRWQMWRHYSWFRSCSCTNFIKFLICHGGE